MKNTIEGWRLGFWILFIAVLIEFGMNVYLFFVMKQALEHCAK